jgi:hypothetical protein
VSDVDPVMVGEPLWTLRKDGHVAEARVRAIPDYGLELRFFNRRRAVLQPPIHGMGAARRGGR